MSDNCLWIDTWGIEPEQPKAQSISWALEGRCKISNDSLNSLSASYLTALLSKVANKGRKKVDKII